ncbi:hypothetical protein DN069_03865 [Streptacidiphilus pinicola]|uniref:Uncharacterized protein n=1 Tax=Streptacidiphilus pinicola TaxID=2219663 RepID=A0A2X0IUC0_9ACTN|nr:hypothetical protein [Streptacidiphilus pinicola]RAG86961.1 hypothetical protein DN069_03865 [Streptacidiphilus pinicola]
MRFSRVHSVIAGTTLAAVLAGSSLWATAEAAPQSVGTTTQYVVQHHRLPAADPSTALGLLGKLGAVQDTIASLTAMASAKPAPSAADIQAAAAKVTSAITDLKNAAPTSPLPVDGKHARGLVPNPLGDALTKLQGDVTALVSALTTVPPDLSKVTAALTAIVTDLLAVVTQTVASLGLSLPVPIPVAHH